MSCHFRPRAKKHGVCKKYKDVRFRCNHIIGADDLHLQWWESWTVCTACKYDEAPGRAEKHWKRRPNQEDDYEPGVKMAPYSCFHCWNRLVVPSRLNVFQTEREPRLLKSDRENMLECTQYHLEKVHPTQQVGRWCCGNTTDRYHNPFSCQMTQTPTEGGGKPDSRRARQVRRKPQAIAVKPKPEVPLGTDTCIVS